MKMTMKTFSAFIQPDKNPNERFYLLKFLTPVMLLFVKLTVIFVFTF